MQTMTDRHLDKREKKALSFETRASKKRVLATVKKEIAERDPETRRSEELRGEHADLCASLKKRST